MVDTISIVLEKPLYSEWYRKNVVQLIRRLLVIFEKNIIILKFDFILETFLSA